MSFDSYSHLGAFFVSAAIGSALVICVWLLIKDAYERRSNVHQD